MKPVNVWAKRLCLVAACFIASAGPYPQQRPLTRHFYAPAEERYQVTLTLRAESHSVATETVAAQTYVTPVAHAAEVKTRWRVVRKILLLQSDGAAKVEEAITPGDQRCQKVPLPERDTDMSLQASLQQFCAFWLKGETIRYTENTRGMLGEVSSNANENELPPLAETAPQLMSLWLRRAVRPNVILPQLQFAIGANSQQRFEPSGDWMEHAHGSEATEWLDAQEQVPAATLHVVQQLSWNPSLAADNSGSVPARSSAQKEEAFFSDSLSTVSLQDGSLLRANRSASRTTARHLDPVPGLPQPPDFSTKLTLTVVIERLR